MEFGSVTLKINNQHTQNESCHGVFRFLKKKKDLGVCVGCLFLRSPSQDPYRTELIPRAPKGVNRTDTVSKLKSKDVGGYVKLEHPEIWYKS